MELIIYKPFYDDISLKITILDVMNKVSNFDSFYQKVIFDLLMYEIKDLCQIIRLDKDYNTMFWEAFWGPCDIDDLSISYINSYYINIRKYHDSTELILEVISVENFVKKEYNTNDAYQWLKNKELIKEKSMSYCNIL